MASYDHSFFRIARAIAAGEPPFGRSPTSRSRGSTCSASPSGAPAPRHDGPRAPRRAERRGRPRAEGRGPSGEAEAKSGGDPAADEAPAGRRSRRSKCGTAAEPPRHGLHAGLGRGPPGPRRPPDAAVPRGRRFLLPPVLSRRQRRARARRADLPVADDLVDEAWTELVGDVNGALRAVRPETCSAADVRNPRGGVQGRHHRGRRARARRVGGAALPRRPARAARGGPKDRLLDGESAQTLWPPGRCADGLPLGVPLSCLVPLDGRPLPRVPNPDLDRIGAASSAAVGAGWAAPAATEPPPPRGRSRGSSPGGEPEARTLRLGWGPGRAPRGRESTFLGALRRSLAPLVGRGAAARSRAAPATGAKGRAIGSGWRCWCRTRTTESTERVAAEKLGTAEEQRRGGEPARAGPEDGGRPRRGGKIRDSALSVRDSVGSRALGCGAASGTEDSGARLRPGCAHRCRRSFSAVVCSIPRPRAGPGGLSVRQLVFVSLLLLMLLELGLVALALEVGYAVAGDASASSELFGWAFFLCPPLCALISPCSG